MKNKKLISKIIDGALNVLIVLFAIFLLISMYTVIQVKVLKNEYSNFFGYSSFEVQTGSMHGTIEAGDWIIVKGTKDVKIGDIITYKHGNDFITHRVMESYKGTYVTKGDANNSKDDPIDQSQVIGKVVKIMHGFGILRKTIFNPTVIILLIITLYLFNLTFKTTKSSFDIKVEILIKKLKVLINEKINNKKDTKVKVVKEKPITIEAKRIEKPVEEIVEVKEEKPKEEVEEKVEEKEEPKEEVIEEVKEEVKEEITEEQKEEELSKTSVFRMISIRPEKKKEEVKKEINEEKKEEELSKTSMFRFISVDNRTVNTKIEPKVEVKEEKKEKKEKSIQLYAEEVEKKKEEKKITQEYIYSKIKSKKCKNIADKAFYVKRVVYDEILDVLLKPCKAYIFKSNMRNDFIEQYLTYKYFGLEQERKNAKRLIKEYGENLVKRFIRDENKVNTVNAYTDAFIFISNIEDKRNCNYAAEISNIFDYDKNTVDTMAYNISNIINYSNEFLDDVLDKLETKSFEIKYNKFVDQKNLYGVILNHNIAFSKVYSDYIVDKTYSEGIVSEDKLAVLLNMLLCRVVFDIMRFDYSSKYFVYIPIALYGKDKKLDKIVSIVDNEYAKSHIYFLTSASNMLNNKDDFQRLRKRGYSFACVFDTPIEYKHDDKGYIYMADYYFVDSLSDFDNVCKGVPSEITDQVIVDSISKKVGDFGGE